MGLLKKLSRSRSSEKVPAGGLNTSFDSHHSSAPSSGSRFLKFRSRSKAGEKAWDDQRNVSLHRSTTTLPTERGTNEQSPMSKYANTSLSSYELSFQPPHQRAVSIENSPFSSNTYESPISPAANFAQSSQSPPTNNSYINHLGRPQLPPAPAPPSRPPPVKPHMKSESSSNNPERFEKPVVIEIPRIVCSKCNVTCTVEALKIGNLYYHPQCFICSVCKVALSNSPYFAKEGGIYCSKDFNALFGTKCRSCKKYIHGDVVAVLGFTYHPSCFNCSRCGTTFEAGQEVIIDKEDTYCENCPISKKPDNVDLCLGCKKTILDQNKAVSALESSWHPQCLKCCVCAVRLTREYFVHDQSVFCELDYLKQFGVKCNTCNSYIVGKVIEAGSKRYHPKCALCSVCGGIFAEGQDMLVHGDEVWHPHCNLIAFNNQRSSTVVPDNRPVPEIQACLKLPQDQPSFPDPPILGQDLSAYNVVTLDYSVPDFLLREVNRKYKQLNPGTTQELEEIRDRQLSPRDVTNIDVYQNVPAPLPTNYFNLPKEAIASIEIPQKPQLKNKYSTPLVSPNQTEDKPPTPNRLRSHDSHNGYTSPVTCHLSSPNLSEISQQMPRSRSFDRNRKNTPPLSAPMMTENMFRCKSNDRLKVFQPKGSEAYIGGYLNPADPSDLAPGIFTRFPNLKTEARQKQKSMSSIFNDPIKYAQRNVTRPGNLNLNNRYNGRRTTSDVIDGPTLNGSGVHPRPKPGITDKDAVFASARYLPPKSRSSYDIGNRSIRVDSDDYVQNSAKCFYEQDRKKRREEVIETPNNTVSATDESDESKFDKYLAVSGIGKDYLMSSKKSDSITENDEFQVSDDPRSASRTPSALVSPVNPLRFLNPHQASPSRVLGYFEINDVEDNCGAEHTADLVEPNSRSKRVESLNYRRRRDFSMGSVTTDDSGLDCFSEPEGRKSFVENKSTKSYRSDFEPETSTKQRKTNQKRAKLLHDNFINYMKAVKQGNVQGYVTDENLDEADDTAAAKMRDDQVLIYPLNKLKTTNKNLPKGVKRRNLEVHLSEQDFHLTFKMSRKAFYDLPLWKRNILKKLNYLF